MPVPRDVAEGLEQIRLGGMVNMLDRPGIIALARLMELDLTADWIEANPSEYSALIFRGVQAIEEGGAGG